MVDPEKPIIIICRRSRQFWRPVEHWVELHLLLALLLSQLVHNCPLKMKVTKLDVHSPALHLKDIAERKVGALLQVHHLSSGCNVWP